MFCKNCGTELEDQTTFCPNCGAEQQAPPAEPQAQPAPQQAPPPAEPQPARQPAPAPNPQATQPVAKKVNGLGIAGFVVALLSLWLGVYFCIASIIGLTLSAVAMGLHKRYNSCNGLAIAGLVIGIISVVIWGIIWIAAASILAEFGMI